MNHRERVLTTLHHKEPDRVPIDLGGHLDSGISVTSYRELRRYLGLGSGKIHVCDFMDQTALVEEDVRRALGVDTMGVLYEPKEWRKDPLNDGSPAYFPSKFRPQIQDDGSQVVLDSAGNVLLKMPKNGYYFDPVYAPLADATSVSEIDRYADAIESYDRPSFWDKSYEELALKAKELHDNTDYLLIAFFGGHIFQSSQSLRGWENFLVDLLVNQKFAEALMDRQAEGHMKRFERYAETVGKYVQVVHVEDDLGMQDGPIISPKLYRKMVKPYHQKVYSFIKSKCDAYLMLHTDGSVYPFIPDFVEMGVDILNPVQVSAKDMDTKRLKREFGHDLTFWGGGCDTQKVLPFGSPEEVRDEVKRRIDDLAPGGGFVFNQVHIIQPHVPVENIVAMFETAREYGVY